MNAHAHGERRPIGLDGTPFKATQRERDRAVVETWRKRFLRRAAGRISAREARDLGRRWLDLALRFGGDNLAGRTFAKDFASAKKYGHASVETLAKSNVDRFWHYGASYGCFERDRPFEACAVCGRVAFGRVGTTVDDLRPACRARWLAWLDGGEE